MKIDPDKFYTITELLELGRKGYLPYKVRRFWFERIREGKVRAIKKGTGPRFTYCIEGKDLINFLDVTKSGF